MADAKISALASASAISTNDLLPIVQNILTTPVTRKISGSDLILGYVNNNSMGDITTGKISTSGSVSITGNLIPTGDVYTSKGTWNPYASSTPTSHGFSSLPGGGVYRYIKIGKLCTLMTTELNNGVSDGNIFVMDLPFTAATATNMFWHAAGRGINNSVNISNGCLARVSSAATTLSIYNGLDAQTWTTSGSKSANFVLTYETA